MVNLSPELQEQLDTLPQKPGVYIMKDAAGKVIYVGKAVNLRSRVRSYFHESAQGNMKTARLVADIAGIEFIVTASELEALVLENTLIKRYRPRYNVRLRDDKTYPYVRVTWHEPFPKVMLTRHVVRDGSRYFGPYTSVQAVHQTLDVLRRLFPFRTCDREITGRDPRPCLYYHIKRCSGPCIGAISQEEYRDKIAQLMLFLEGQTGEVVRRLEAQMKEAAEALEFERAAQLRDQIWAIEKVVEGQRVVSPHLRDHDIVAFARDDGNACVQVFFVRNGRLIGREYFFMEGAEGEEAGAILSSFLSQFYAEASSVPPEIILPVEADEANIIKQWLASKRGADVVLMVPQNTERQSLLQMAQENARETLEAMRAQWMSDQAKQAGAVSALQEALMLPKPPARIECYDISNIQGTAATGSMVVFVNGVPRKSDYRRFQIRTVEGADDYAMMREVLRRRFLRYQQAQQALEEGRQSTARSLPDAFALLPDLLIVDGGKGQLHVALEVLEEMGLRESVPAAALAKQEEEIYLPDMPEPLRLPADSPALHLLQRIRDEAHRFAVGYHRRLREAGALRSMLDEIPGIGPRRRQALLKHFGSLERIRQASVEELAQVPGMTRQAAERLKEYLGG